MRRIPFPTGYRSPIMRYLFSKNYALARGTQRESTYMQWRMHEKKHGRNVLARIYPADFFRTRALYTSESICQQCHKILTTRAGFRNGVFLCKDCWSVV